MKHSTLPRRWGLPRFRCRLSVVLLGLLAACDFELVLSEDQHPGTLFVDFVNEAGECVTGAGLEFRAPDGSIQRGLAAYGCSFGTSGPPGEWRVFVTPPAGYALAPAQPNPIQATVVKDREIRIRVVLARRE